MNLNAVSLFSCSGIGDLGLHANGITTVANIELLENRMVLFARNHPQSKGFLGDIREKKHELIKYFQENYGDDLFLLLATPPCQGMSLNGAGKLLREYKLGKRPKLDERNRLIIDTLDVACALQPQWILIENVPQMQHTSILDEQGNLVNIIDYMRTRLGDNYVGGPTVINMADYGIPQRRKRLITIFSRTEKGKAHFEKYQNFIPPFTHSKNPTETLAPWISLREALKGIPSLDATEGLATNLAFHQFHYVNVLDPKKYFWIQHTPTGQSAFNNQCINPSCQYDRNPLYLHNSTKQHIKDGTCKAAPLYCEKCGELLPRPYTEKENGEKVLMNAFTSAYKRMDWDMPASTITRNFHYPSSDNKLHPSENRVLSTFEALLLHTILDYPYTFELNGKPISKSLIADTIGESVPPKLFDIITKHLKTIERGD